VAVQAAGGIKALLEIANRDPQKLTIRLAAADIAIVFAANFSVGVNVLLKLLGDKRSADGRGRSTRPAHPTGSRKKRNRPSSSRL
ncbi:hypothetical protein SJZ73_27790, partial [Klebsiella pneumoniae]|nr:hypothetical protein [Klebsiella pneumoniae]